eukprot:maker-scaffold665_size116259-snap-gene-0.15 protein:Tk02702 transcript:maker-scaffold665_size116259-snap-gene-0.15-mRNA-1 annotation:"transmembrane protein "
MLSSVLHSCGAKTKKMSYSNTLKELFYMKESNERGIAALAASTNNAATPTIVVDHPSSSDGEMNSPQGSPRANWRKHKEKHLSPLDLRISVGSLTAPPSPSPSLRSRGSEFFRMHSASLTSLFEKERRQQLVESHMGLALALISAILMSVYSHMYKQISDKIARPSVVVLRGLIQALGLFLIAHLQKVPLKPKNLGVVDPSQSSFWTKYRVYIILAVVVVFGGFRLCLIFAGLQLIHMSTVHTILNGAPILVMVLSHFLLQNDRFSVVKGLSCILLIAGVLLNFQPYKWLNDSFEIGFGLGVAFSMGALIFSAFGSVFTKMISKNFDKLHISSYIGVSILVVALFSLLTDSVIMNLVQAALDPELEDRLMDIFPNTTVLDNHDGYDLKCIVNRVIQDFNITSNATEIYNDNAIPEDVMSDCLLVMAPYLPTDVGVWVNAFFVGILGSVQQLCIIAALQKDKPSKVTMVRSLNILISFTIQSSTSSVPDPLEAIGALLVLLAITFVAFETPVAAALKKVPGLQQCFDCNKAEDQGQRKTNVATISGDGGLQMKMTTNMSQKQEERSVGS